MKTDFDLFCDAWEREGCPRGQRPGKALPGYRVFPEALTGRTLDDGRDPMDVVRSLPGLMETPWGGLYLPEDLLDQPEHAPFLDWLFEQGAVATAKG